MSKQDWRELQAYRALGKPEELCKKQNWISVKGLHCCSKCGKAAFNYNAAESGEVVEVCAPYCACCGAKMDEGVKPR